MKFVLSIKTTFLLLITCLLAFPNLPEAHAGKQMKGPWTVYSNGGAVVTPGLGAAGPLKTSFRPDYTFDDSKFGSVAIENEVKVGDAIYISNTSSGDKAKTAYLLVEQLSSGGVLIRLQNHEGFNYEHCTGKDPKPGMASGEGGGKFCTAYGLKVGSGGPFGILAKVNADSDFGIKLMAPKGSIKYRLSEEGTQRTIDKDTAIQLKLNAGTTIKIEVGSLPSHKRLAQEDKVRYHLAEEKGGISLASRHIAGEITFKAKFEPSPDGGPIYKREIRPGDVVKVFGDEESQDFSFVAQESNNGSLLRIKRDAPWHQLKFVQINNEDKILLVENASVTIASKGGEAGWRNESEGKEWGLADGATRFVQKGNELEIDSFTTLKSSGGIRQPGEKGPVTMHPVFPLDPIPPEPEDPEPNDPPAEEPDSSDNTTESASNKDAVNAGQGTNFSGADKPMGCSLQSSVQISGFFGAASFIWFSVIIFGALRWSHPKR